MRWAPRWARVSAHTLDPGRLLTTRNLDGRIKASRESCRAHGCCDGRAQVAKVAESLLAAIATEYSWVHNGTAVTALQPLELQ
jgi:hypothetical protein